MDIRRFSTSFETWQPDGHLLLSTEWVKNLANEGNFKPNTMAMQTNRARSRLAQGSRKILMLIFQTWMSFAQFKSIKMGCCCWLEVGSHQQLFLEHQLRNSGFYLIQKTVKN